MFPSSQRAQLPFFLVERAIFFHKGKLFKLHSSHIPNFQIIKERVDRIGIHSIQSSLSFPTCKPFSFMILYFFIFLTCAFEIGREQESATITRAIIVCRGDRLRDTGTEKAFLFSSC